MTKKLHFLKTNLNGYPFFVLCTGQNEGYCELRPKVGRYMGSKYVTDTPK